MTRFGKFYIEAPGQLKDNEEIFLCEETYEAAVEDMKGIYPRYQPTVRRIQTIDSDIPFKDTAGVETSNHESTRFASYRYAVILTIPEAESERKGFAAYVRDIDCGMGTQTVLVNDGKIVSQEVRSKTGGRYTGDGNPEWVGQDVRAIYGKGFKRIRGAKLRDLLLIWEQTPSEENV